jgi:hypothetical protein
MIYVRRDVALIPEGLLKAAKEACQALEALPKEARKPYLKKKRLIWQRFARHLAKMSYGKCWYSESIEPQSFLDVDHFRPKSEAIRSTDEKDDGYPWLAFDWDNFRLSAIRSNLSSTNEDSGKVGGKSSWFPLINGSPKATWADRCTEAEKPILLDPTVRSDVDLIEVAADGNMCSSKFCIGSAEERVKRSIELYGLNLPKLVEARKRVMRDVSDNFKILMDLFTVGGVHPGAADQLPVRLQADQLRRKTLPNSAYSKAARAMLIELGVPQLCAQPGRHGSVAVPAAVWTVALVTTVLRTCIPYTPSENKKRTCAREQTVHISAS